MPRFAVAELALDHDERDAFAGPLDGGGVAELMWREATPDACSGGGATQLGPSRGRRPVAPASRAVDDAQQRTDRELAPKLEPRQQLCPPQPSMPTSRRRPPLPRRTSNEPRR